MRGVAQRVVDALGLRHRHHVLEQRSDIDQTPADEPAQIRQIIAVIARVLSDRNLARLTQIEGVVDVKAAGDEQKPAPFVMPE